MCGIFGYYVKNNKKLNNNKKLIENMGLMAQFRGDESTGIAFETNIKSNKKTIISKDLCSFQDYKKIYSKEINLALKSKIFMAHTRNSSSGDVSLENAHPFLIDNHICAHNGTFRNKISIASSLRKLMPDGFTDSELAFCYLLENKKCKMCMDYLAELGDFAFEIYDNKNKELTLATNSGNLYYVKCDDFILWASTENMVKSAIRHLKPSGVLSKNIAYYNGEKIYQLKDISITLDKDLCLVDGFTVKEKKYYVAGYTQGLKTYYRDDRQSEIDKEKETEKQILEIAGREYLFGDDYYDDYEDNDERTKEIKKEKEEDEPYVADARFVQKTLAGD